MNKTGEREPRTKGDHTRSGTRRQWRLEINRPTWLRQPPRRLRVRPRMRGQVSGPHTLAARAPQAPPTVADAPFAQVRPRQGPSGVGVVQRARVHCSPSLLQVLRAGAGIGCLCPANKDPICQFNPAVKGPPWTFRELLLNASSGEYSAVSFN